MKSIEQGRCSACRGAAERGAAGTWWHAADTPPCGDPGATFQAARQQPPPRDRQIRHPGRDR